jgi:hypothetical protein
MDVWLPDGAKEVSADIKVPLASECTSCLANGTDRAGMLILIGTFVSHDSRRSIYDGSLLRRT